MPITFQQMVSESATINFTYNDYPIKIVYFPGKLTEEFVGAVIAMNAMDASTFNATFKTYNEQLCDVIESWDVLENDGVTMIPLTPERLAKLPFKFRAKLSQEIMGDMRPEASTPQTAN